MCPYSPMNELGSGQLYTRFTRFLPMKILTWNQQHVANLYVAPDKVVAFWRSHADTTRFPERRRSLLALQQSRYISVKKYWPKERCVLKYVGTRAPWKFGYTPLLWVELSQTIKNTWCRNIWLRTSCLYDNPRYRFPATQRLCFQTLCAKCNRLACDFVAGSFLFF